MSEENDVDKQNTKNIHFFSLAYYAWTGTFVLSILEAAGLTLANFSTRRKNLN